MLLWCLQENTACTVLFSAACVIFQIFGIYSCTYYMQPLPHKLCQDHTKNIYSGRSASRDIQHCTKHCNLSGVNVLNREVT